MLAESEQREIVGPPPPSPPSEGLVFVTADEPGIVRRRAGRGFACLAPDRARMTAPKVIGRVRVPAIQALPGRPLFGYRDGAGSPQASSSGDVNASLKGVTGQDISATDFRTGAATALTAEALAASAAAPWRKALDDVVKTLASRLGDTPTVCRASDVHAEIVAACLNGDVTLRRHGGGCDGLAASEWAVVDFLRRRLTGADAPSTGHDRDAAHAA